MKQGVLTAAGLDAAVIPEIKNTGCYGFCSRGPLVIIAAFQGIFYQHVQPKDVEEIVQTTVVEGEAGRAVVV